MGQNNNSSSELSGKWEVSDKTYLGFKKMLPSPFIYYASKKQIVISDPEQTNNN